MTPFDVAAYTLIGSLVLGSTVGGFGTIDSGHVGVETRFGIVHTEELPPGAYWAPWAEVREYSAKEVAVKLDDLRPKAADNLFIQELDLTVYYRAAPSMIAELEIKYTDQSEQVPEADDVYAPAYRLVRTLTRNAAYQEVAKLPSLTVHQQREEMAERIRARLADALEREDPGVFTVTRAVIRSVVTDPAIERAIQAAVNNQKRLEAMAIAVEIAAQEAEVRLREARGIAAANRIIADTLTPAYLQHEANKVLMEFADGGGPATIVIPANIGAAPLTDLPVTAAGAAPPPAPGR